MKETVAFRALRGQRVCLDRKVTLASQERRESLASGAIPDRMDFRVSRAALGSEDTGAPEASGGTGVEMEKTGWMESMENRE